MKNNVLHSLVLITCSFSLTPTLLAEELVMEGTILTSSEAMESRNKWGIGLGIATQSSVYRDYDNVISGFPLLSYEGDYFFLRGLSAGVSLVKNTNHTVHIDISYEFSSFNPKNTDDLQMKKLDKRRATAMLGVGYSYQDTWGIMHAHVGADILGKSKGILMDVGYMYPITLGNLRVTPGIGVQWANKKHNNYYYGISEKEAAKSGLNAYEAGNGFTPYVDISLQYKLQKDWDLFMSGRLNILSDNVKKSPMVNKSNSGSLALGVKYSF